MTAQKSRHALTPATMPASLRSSPRILSSQTSSGLSEWYMFIRSASPPSFCLYEANMSPEPPEATACTHAGTDIKECATAQMPVLAGDGPI
eukprot:scaffold68878_cov73-Phaeocystis_antarctica.AAC.1